METSKTQQRHTSLLDLGQSNPKVVIAYALLIALGLYLAFDLFQAATSSEQALNLQRIMRILGGFIATGVGMLLVWIVMLRKEKELLRLRDQSSREASAALLQNQFMLQDFLSVINHRMRTPIHANARMADLMSQGSFGAVTERQSELLLHMVHDSEDLDRLFGMLIDICNYKSKSKQLCKGEVKLDRLVKDCIDALESKTAEAHVTIQADLQPGTVFADHEELAKLLRHLLDDAVKYARSKINVRSGRHPSGQAYVVITDDGKGMPPADVVNLFRRFYHQSSDGKYPPATGVGLCLCAEIADAHGGEITCNSVVGQGTTFVLELPTGDQQN